MVCLKGCDSSSLVRVVICKMPIKGMKKGGIMRRLILLALILVVVVCFVGCPKKNEPPEIQEITVTPADSVKPGEKAHLKVDADDPDGDKLDFTWSASGGTLSATTGEEVDWTAPQDTGTYTITVEAEDKEGETDKATKNIKVYGGGGVVSGSNNTAVTIYDDGYWYGTTITISGAPNNAVADSFELTSNITHEYDPSYLAVAIEFPDGRAAILFDGDYPGGQVTSKWNCTTVSPPIPVNGEWGLYGASYAYYGYLNSWSIKIWYHTQ